MRLFENNLHRSANPDLRLFEVEDRCYCGSYIVLHHAYIVKPKPFLDILAGNDERSFHLLHRLSAMSFVDATMIGSQYENSIPASFTAWTIWPTYVSSSLSFS